MNTPQTLKTYVTRPRVNQSHAGFAQFPGPPLLWIYLFQHLLIDIIHKYFMFSMKYAEVTNQEDLEEREGSQMSSQPRYGPSTRLNHGLYAAKRHLIERLNIFIYFIVFFKSYERRRRAASWFTANDAGSPLCTRSDGDPAGARHDSPAQPPPPSSCLFSLDLFSGGRFETTWPLVEVEVREVKKTHRGGTLESSFPKIIPGTAGGCKLAFLCVCMCVCEWVSEFVSVWMCECVCVSMWVCEYVSVWVCEWEANLVMFSLYKDTHRCTITG